LQNAKNLQIILNFAPSAYGNKYQYDMKVTIVIFQGLLCDITVRVQGHLFTAHINILASSMGYFRYPACLKSP